MVSHFSKKFHKFFKQDFVEDEVQSQFYNNLPYLLFSEDAGAIFY